MKLIDKIFDRIYNPTLKLSQNEWREIKESINPYINELENELEEYRKNDRMDGIKFKYEFMRLL